MTTTRPRLLFLGGGPVVSDLYVPALARMGWEAGLTVADLSATTLTRLSARAPWVRTVAMGFAEALADPAVRSAHDAVVVCLPNRLHVAGVRASLEAGYPVLCEKPLALRQSECESLAAAADTYGFPLMVGMVRRLAGSAVAAGAALRSELLGRLLEVDMHHGGPFQWISDSGEFFSGENGGILADMGVHHLDWLQSLLGPLVPDAYVDDWSGGVEVSCDYRLHTTDGVPVRMRISHRHVGPDETVFRGERAEVVVGKNDLAFCRLRGLVPGIETQLRPEQPFGDPSWPRDLISCFCQQLDDFARVVRGERARYVTGRDAAATMGLIEHAYSTRRRRVAVPEPDRPALPAGRTVVTGGTGFIGTVLVERLADLGFSEIVVPVRGYRTCASVARYPVQLPRVNLTDREQVRAAVKGARWVFHLALGWEGREARRITVDGTKIVVEEAAAQGAEAVVVLSTMFVFGHPQTDALVDESWPYDPAGGVYGKTKAEMEKWCLQVAPSLGRTRLVVLNPSCVFGREGKAYTRQPSELAKNGAFAWWDSGVGVANFTYIDNTIDAMLLTAGHPEAAGKRFLVTDGWCSWKEFLSPLLDRPAHEFPSFSTAEFTAMKGAAARKVPFGRVLRDLPLQPTLRDWAAQQPWLAALPWVAALKERVKARYTSGELYGTESPTEVRANPSAHEPELWTRTIWGPTVTRFSNARLRSLGWSPRIDLATAQRRTVEWLREMGILCSVT